ncbi:SRPBCC family protein [Nocardia huaxiensis]|uniref:SRPBCC family protein n=1 Tax=Nocardia huaxiensis TaxID=2755382 RepID=A0A7D6VE81_9NOCA|nr:SRPBCC family protein [Nocardia huaxiensis]QLY28116.1 SRPBCC family protein [Nocardia huaxiensis]UFS98443.1 SRPBCC family protein [Nocardia huaxiensis]
MRTVETSATLHAQPDEIWKVIGNPLRWGEWLVIHKSWKTDVPEALETGVTATAAATVMNMPITIDWTFDEVDRFRSIALSGTTRAAVTLALDIRLRAQGATTGVDVVARINGGMIDGPMGGVFAKSIVGALDKSLAKMGALSA